MRLLFAVLTVLVLAEVALSQCFTRGRAVCAPVYHAPAIYHAPVVKEVVEVVKFVQVPVYPTVYTVNTGDYSASLIQKAAAFEALQLMMQMRGGNANPEVAPTLPPGAPPMSPAPRAPSTGGVSPALKTLVDGRCVKCHNSTKAGRMNLQDLSKLTRYDWREVWYQVSTEKMPQGGKLTNEELKLFFDSNEVAK